MSPILEVRNLTKKFGGLTAVNDVSFLVNDNFAWTGTNVKSTLFTNTKTISFQIFPIVSQL